MDEREETLAQLHALRRLVEGCIACSDFPSSAGWLRASYCLDWVVAELTKLEDRP
jgi:hypothetical protein